MANNIHKKDYQKDKFGRHFYCQHARHFYCQHARLNQLRDDKKRAERKTRRKHKKFLKNFEKGIDKSE